jgi:hypothetical protein
MTRPFLLLQLLDSGGTRSQQEWIFRDQSQVTVGRSADQHVVLADPYVSRAHAEFLWRDGRWTVRSAGRHGVQLGGRSLNDDPIADGDILQLGPSGPRFRVLFTPPLTSDINGTLSFDDQEMVILRLDRGQLEEETSVIIDSDFFQKLQRIKRARDTRADGRPGTG